MIVCAKHLAEPAKGYHVCVGCEVESLRAEVDRLKVDRLTFRTGHESASNRCVELEAEVARLRSEGAAREAIYPSETRMDTGSQVLLAAPAAGTVEKDALRLAKEAMEAAQRSHGVQLTSYPPQDAWLTNRVDDKLRTALKAVDAAIAAKEPPCSS
jgi:hypothetical protein